jgi:protein tyrosine/serine phosphatase
MNMRSGMVSAILMVCALGGCSPATTGRPMQGVDNFAPVTGAAAPIYRGAQPSLEGYERLAGGDLKVATVIDLRDDAESWSEKAVTSLGMKYKRIATNAGTVDKEKIRQFLRTVAECAAAGPVFVHCRRGRDRTGLEIAMYRVVVQGWTREAAIKELREHGYNRFWFPGIERFIQTFDAGDFRDAVSKGGVTRPPATAASARY